MFFAPELATRTFAAPRRYDSSFQRFLSTSSSNLTVAQDDTAWTVTFDLPGVAKSQLAINVEGAVVRIETSAEARRQFKAAYELPEEIDAEATVATLEDGVLTLKLGKKKPVSNARTIEVR